MGQTPKFLVQFLLNDFVFLQTIEKAEIAGSECLSNFECRIPNENFDSGCANPSNPSSDYKWENFNLLGDIPKDDHHTQIFVPGQGNSESDL